jgi:hypothetical protein
MNIRLQKNVKKKPSESMLHYPFVLSSKHLKSQIKKKSMKNK